MSVNSVKAQLATLLGSNGLPYWRSLSDFLAGKSSRTEFERDIRQWINTAELGMWWMIQHSVFMNPATDKSS